RLLSAVTRLEDAIGYPLRLRGGAAGFFELGIGAPQTEPGIAARVVLEDLRAFGLRHLGARLVHAPAWVRDEVDARGPLPGRAGRKERKDLLDPRGLLAPGRGLGGV